MSMLFKAPLCPTCGKTADGTLDVIYGIALAHRNEDGSFDYSGETEVDWDSQKCVESDNPNTVTLQCSAGHRWESFMEGI